jgi:hypothetical protein
VKGVVSQEVLLLSLGTHEAAFEKAQTPSATTIPSPPLFEILGNPWKIEFDEASEMHGSYR